MKSFKDQIRSCKKSGNLVVVDISAYALEIKKAAVCLKNKCACASGVCLSERNDDQIIHDVCGKPVEKCRCKNARVKIVRGRK